MSPFLDHIAKMPSVRPHDLLRGRPLVVLAPHPDDETLGCGALLHDAAASGTPCTVICVTDGRLSHPRSARWPADRLAGLRRTEITAAVRCLGNAIDLHWMGYPDCGAPDDANAADRIARLIPADALVLATWQGDPHVDHRNVARLAQRIADDRRDIALSYYPIWGRFATVTASGCMIAGSKAARVAKTRALACHASQMTPMIDDDPDGFVMEPWRQSHFLDHAEIVIAR